MERSQGGQAVSLSSYQNAKPGNFTPSEWLDLLLACQDGRVTCMRALQIIEREMDFIRNPKKHVFWGAGEQDCPKDIKAPNGELHTLMCKICGEKSPKYAECKSPNRI